MSPYEAKPSFKNRLQKNQTFLTRQPKRKLALHVSRRAMLHKVLIVPAPSNAERDARNAGRKG